jgi:hypothetical protein
VSSSERPDVPAQLLSRGDDVKVMRGGDEIAWDELAPGDEVRVVYTERLSGPSEIESVEILSGGEEPVEIPQVPVTPGEPDPIPGTPDAGDAGLEPPPLPPDQTPSPMPPGEPR